MSPLLISITAFAAVAAMAWAVMQMFGDKDDDKLSDRLDMLAGKGATSKEPSLKETLLIQPLDAAPGLIEALLNRFGKSRLLFQQADTKLTPSQFGMMSGGLAFLGMMVCVVARLPVWMVPVVALSAGVMPLMYLSMKRKRRLKLFGAQLPEALDLMGRALRSGHSLAASFELVQSELNAPIATEFGRVFEEQNLGLPIEEALEGLTERVPNMDLQFFCTAVVLQRTTGGDLAEILDKIGHLVRERFKIYGQVQALTGEGRLSGIVLLALPPVLFLAVYRLNPNYIMLLFDDPMGTKMLAGAVIMQVLGALVIRKIINIKV
ncbi:MAG: type II secretion system F family protein [Planctomycetes bacterium]|nr:type II secretion system F family protein [Planctomycetota bacterium]